MLVSATDLRRSSEGWQKTKGHPYWLALFYRALRIESGIRHWLLLSPYRSMRGVTGMSAAGQKRLVKLPAQVCTHTVPGADAVPFLYRDILEVDMVRLNPSILSYDCLNVVLGKNS
jgi:hypothetical protein